MLLDRWINTCRFIYIFDYLDLHIFVFQRTITVKTMIRNSMQRIIESLIWLWQTAKNKSEHFI